MHICKCSVILDTHQALVKTISGVLNTMKIHVLNNMKNKHYDHNVVYHVLILFANVSILCEIRVTIRVWIVDHL